MTWLILYIFNITLTVARLCLPELKAARKTVFTEIVPQGTACGKRTSAKNISKNGRMNNSLTTV